MSRKWQSKKVLTSTYYVSERPGIYIIGREEDVEGLPVSSEFAYVGKTKNMRRRLAEHEKLAENNPLLRAYFERHGPRVRVWYTTDLQRAELDDLERNLIRELKPACNRIRYTKRGPNE